MSYNENLWQHVLHMKQRKAKSQRRHFSKLSRYLVRSGTSVNQHLIQESNIDSFFGATK